MNVKKNVNMKIILFIPKYEKKQRTTLVSDFSPLFFTNSFGLLKFIENSKKESPLQVLFVVSFRTLV